MTLYIIRKSASTTFIVCLNLIYLILKPCFTFIFPESFFALETKMDEEKVDCQEQCVIMDSRHSDENHRQ